MFGLPSTEELIELKEQLNRIERQGKYNADLIIEVMRSVCMLHSPEQLARIALNLDEKERFAKNGNKSKHSS